MTPTDAVGSLDTLLFAVGILGVLILAGVLLRLAIGWLRRLVLPAALIGGAIGLALGPHGAGLFTDPVVSAWADMPGVLATVVFAPMLMGVTLPRLRETYSLVAPQLLYGYMGSCLMIGVPLVVTAVLLVPLWGVNDMFGSLVEVGWPGGHGTAGAMSEVFAGQGWEEGASLGQTSATVGLVFGICMGMVLLNWGIRKNHVQAYRHGGAGAGAATSDILPDDGREPMGQVTVSRDLVDTLGLHLALVGLAIMIGWVLQHVIDMVIPGMPLFPLAMIGGALVQLVVARTRLARTIESRVFRTIQGVALDFLVVSAVASIELPVVVENAAPLAVLLVVAALLALAYFFWIGPRVFQRDWFEQSIINFGSTTGVASVGLMLLRTADPELKTVAGRAYALRAPFFSPFVGGGLVTAVVPLLAVSYGALATGLAFCAGFVVLLVLARVLNLWRAPARV
ncbi:sodium/glutamate symporter [Georgenia alba]|uniref:Sodium/glutamate symporter n=1 Tax=Georgenia alba TaxID=2233858 RepID=A0ABW2Q827_9MICO